MTPTVAFEIKEEISGECIEFLLCPEPEKGAPPQAGSGAIIKGYKEYVCGVREEEKRSEFPVGAKFVEPPLKMRVETPLRETESPPGVPPQKRKEPEFRPINMGGLLKEGECFVLIADSGTGKTTLLKELSCRMAGGDLKPDKLPIYFHFRDLLGISSESGLLGKVKELLEKGGTKADASATADALFREGRFVFLLDGLDQVEDHTNLPGLLGRGGTLSRQNVIVAGRPYIYPSLKPHLTHHNYVTLDTFSPAQAKEYLGDTTYASLKTLMQDPKLRAPMLLAVLKELDPKTDGPQNRTDIYGAMVDKLLLREASLRLQKTSSILQQPGAVKDTFARLSYLLLTRGQAGRFPWSTANSLLGELHISRETLSLLTRIGLLSEVIEGTPRLGHDLEFRHQSFQEYLASMELLQKLFANGTLNKEILLNHMEYNRWDEVLFFMVGSLEPERAKQVIEFIKPYDIYLAGRCVAHFRGDGDREFGGIIDELFKRFPEEDAADTLTKIGSEGVVTGFIQRLKDEDVCVRRVAAEALGRIGGERAVGALIEGLKDEAWSVRWAAVKALGRIGGERAVELLIEGLMDEDSGVLWAAAEALGRIGGERAVELLIEGLKDEDSDVRWAAVGALGRIGGERAVEPLIERLKDEDSDVRWAAVGALGQIGGERAVEPLIERLKDEDSDVRSVAAEALGRIGGERAVGALIEGLKDEDWSVRRSAAEALGRIGGERAVGALIERLKDEDWSVRRSAAEALGRIGGERAVGALIERLKDEDSGVRRAAVKVLGRIGGERAVELLIEGLKDEDSDVRKAAAEALGQIGGERAVEPLIERLKDEVSDVRWAAVGALGQIGGERAVEPLIERLKDEDSDVRSVAAEALGQCSQRLNEGKLIELVKGLREGGYGEAINNIKKAHGRRFLRILHAAEDVTS